MWQRMKISVLIPIWKRHDLTAVCFNHLANQQAKYGFDVMIVGSEGQASEQLAGKHGFNYAEFQNEFLGDKMNFGLFHLKDSDAVVVLGSDDFVTDEYWNKIYSLDLKGKVYYGPKSLYFYVTKNKKLSEYTYNGINMKTIGAGRIYSKDALKAVNYALWSPEKNTGLDADAGARLRSVGVKEVVIDGYHLIDVKHSDNITGHAVARVGKEVSNSIIAEKFGIELKNQLDRLTPNGPEKVGKDRKSPTMEERVIIKMLKSGGGLAEGKELMRPLRSVKPLIKSGSAVVIPAFTGEEPSKKTEPCKDCKEKKEIAEPCIPCEQKAAELAKTNTNDNGKTGNEVGKQSGNKAAGKNTGNNKKGK